MPHFILALKVAEKASSFEKHQLIEVSWRLGRFINKTFFTPTTIWDNVKRLTKIGQEQKILITDFA